MKNSLRKVMSATLAIIMLFSLFVPVAFANADYPTLTMKIVDDNGAEVEYITPGAELWLRVSATVSSSFHTASVIINEISGIEFDTSKSIKKLYLDDSTFADFEINDDTGINVAAGEVSVLFSSKLTAASPTVDFSGEIAFVDIPVKVVGEVGDAVEACFLNDGSFTVYVYEEGDTDPYYIDAGMLNVVEINSTVRLVPYAITNIALNPEFAPIEKQEEGSGYVFPGFGGSKVLATYDLDRDENGSADTFEYDIITNLADASADAYAYVDISTLNVEVAGIYPLNVTVYDDSIKDTNGSAPGQYSGTVSVAVKGGSGIKGKVTVANTSGQLFNFSAAIPVGAVVTAVPVSATNMSYVGNSYGVSNLANTEAYSTIVDGNGDFVLELEKGDYHIIVSHSMYAIRKMGAASQLTIMRTVLDGQSKQIVTIGDEELDMGNIALRYAYYGDMNLDGALNPSDYGIFKGNFNNTVPAVQ